MGHYWSEMASDDEQREHEKKIKRDSRIKSSLKQWAINDLKLGAKDAEYLADRLSWAIRR